MRAEPREQSVVDGVRVEGELLRVGERGLLGVAERTVLEVEERGELLVRRAVPRSLRGVGARSILAGVEPRDERGHKLLRPHRHGAGVRDRAHVRDHRLEDLGTMGVDAVHVRHVAALLADLDKLRADLGSDFVFGELAQTSQGDYSFSSSTFPFLMTSGSVAAAASVVAAGSASARRCVTPTTTRSGSSRTFTPSGSLRSETRV